MPDGARLAFDQIATTIIATPSLLVDDSGVTTFARYPSRFDLDDGPDTGIHRRFHLTYEGEDVFAGTGGRFVGNVTDSYVTFAVQVAYFEGGGDAVATQGERHSIDRVAMDDLNRIRQRVEHPDQYDAATTGIQLITWLGTRRLAVKPGTARRIYEIRFRVWIEHARLGAA